MKLIHTMFALALFTASFDLYLVIEAGGSLRFAQIMMIFVIAAGLFKIAQRGAILWPKGGTALLVWFLLQTAFVPFSHAGRTGVLFHLLLTFTLAGIFAVLQLYGRSAYLESLMKVYLSSFVFVGLFGLLQAASPLLHLGKWLVLEWLIPGKIARVNGFSYEPSYFATYLIMGWIMLLDLRQSGARITARRRWRSFAFLLGLALFVSTSKTAWIFMLLEGMARLTPHIVYYARAQTARLRRGDISLILPRPRVLVTITAGLLGLVMGLAALGRAVNLNVFLGGTGLNHTAAHSVVDRTNRFSETMSLFWEQPLAGRSLAGVAASIAERHSAPFNSVADLRLWWGNPVIADVLAASGIFGIVPFLWFFFTNTIGEFKLIRQHWPEEQAKWMLALVRALIFECLFLLADQNLLRVYLWFHVSMVVVVGFNLRYCAGNPALQEGADRSSERQLATA
jgi:hypothetical protein